MRSLFVCLLLACAFPSRGGTPSPAPGDVYAVQIARQLALLDSADARIREGAVEALGYLRAWPAADGVAGALADNSAGVRREAAMNLGWIGTRKHIPPLLSSLDDQDWTVRQAAWVALTNLTGMQWPFDALAAPQVRAIQAQTWKDWWSKVPADRAPQEVFELLKGDTASSLAAGCKVTASSVYKGPPEALTDGLHETFWQTKNAPFPQYCTLDLGSAIDITRLVVHQYGPGFCMTDFGLSVSTDGENFKQVHRATGPVQPVLVIEIARTNTRFVRLTSYASQNKTYPTTIREIEVFAGPAIAGAPATENPYWRKERGLRALGVMGGPGAYEAVVSSIERYAKQGAADASQKAMVQAGIRSLGRLKDARALPILIAFLEHPHWARYAIEALGDLGNEQAVAALVKVYPRYSRDLAGKPPVMLPADDHPGLEPADRMYEIPYAIALTLSRLPPDQPESVAAVREIVPLMLANLPGDFDGAVLYEPEPSREIAACVLRRVGLLEAAARATLGAVGRKVEIGTGDPSAIAQAARRKVGTTTHAASWLPAFCAETKYADDLLVLLEHEDGWVRINAAKALMFLGEKRAIEPIARILVASKREADHGYFGGFMFTRPTQGHDEYDDPSPRWREAYVRALGRLGANEHVPLLARLLNDDANALEVQYASAVALGELGIPAAIEELKKAHRRHAYHSVRLVAREALWRRGIVPPVSSPAESGTGTPRPGPTVRALAALPLAQEPALPAGGLLDAIVFIKGDSVMPNRFQIDPWRQTYSTTDSGPTYRLGRNLYVLRPATAQGKATPLTVFNDGYVADCEVSWDATRIVFARRGGDKDPWWHIWEMNADGSGLRQLTRGPYHDVQPAYMPDGRIVFSSSRIGLRDEYHGYLATGLTVMNADGSDIHCIGFNLGRDNEPAILADGRIGFGRLELFYSRLKTEITLEAAHPDGTRNVVLYGPERRDFWRDVTRQSGERWWGEVPPRHRVLRITQTQSLDTDQMISVSTAGLVVIGPSRYGETLVPHDRAMAVTTPFPLGDGRILCAATTKRPLDTKDFDSAPLGSSLGIYVMELATGKMTLLYDDPQSAEFEPRPLVARRQPPVLPENPEALGDGYTARLMCASAQITQEPLVRERGRLVRIVEGQPITGRHANHNSPGINAWKNHTGTNARVLGTVPLAADGSFHVEVPADRFVHAQILDSDRRVVGNQIVWMYARPGETRSCIGCHENPQISPSPTFRPQAATTAAIPCLPTGGEFTYRAKLWNKGILTDESEERTRTVRAVNLIGRQ